MYRIAVIAALTAACTTPPHERLDRPDVPVPPKCHPGSETVSVSGTVVDLDGKPVAGVSIDLTTAWTQVRAFPANGCLVGHATSGADGTFGPVEVIADYDPVIVALATGAGLAPTIADRRTSCLFGCGDVEMTVVTVPADLATAWREELFDGGMEYALNRGLVAFQFLERDRAPAAGVKPTWMDDSGLDDDVRSLEPDSQVRFLSDDRRTLAATGTEETLKSGFALIGLNGDERGYFAVRGERGGAGTWGRVGSIVATGWIYFETGDFRQ